MTKIVFNYEYLYKNCVPKINKIYEDFINLKNMCDNLNIPFDFAYYSYLKELSSKLNLLANDYEKIVDNIDSLNINLNNSMISISDNINNINDIKK